MPTQVRLPKHTVAEKKRVLDAHRAGRADWLMVAASNGFSRSIAYALVNRGRADNKRRGGARRSVTKVTPAIKHALETYLDDNCTYTLESMKKMLIADGHVGLSISTISRQPLGMLYTVKLPRVVSMTCNNMTNKMKRQVFASRLKEHQCKGDCIVYFDETKFNVYCKRGRGRAKRGELATVAMVPSKGPNLQIQCAVNSTIGVVLYRLQRGSIKMEEIAEFVEEIYKAVKASPAFADNYKGKNVVIVFDNAPAHRQTEDRITEHDDMVLMRLAPYSPMCNPIENCFSVLKSHIKEHLARDREAICDRSNMVDEDGAPLTISVRQMRFLERAAKASMKHVTPTLVAQMELHARDAVTAAETMDDMCYGE
ncbi:hypothetical protein PHPALM_28242 [Phytophthora palmivora]|uniref:Tc1-like transposase DDE domain-containing protein n=1 Tax=Phytophthora palmivora TaxID=4796 RepID=A0A2P4XAL5_9STRA|nr:hypothetical protein PHPALM_28242 [Phytophthora palmivora]